MNPSEDVRRIAGFISAGMATLTPGPAARSIEITRYRGAAERASMSSAAGIALSSATRSNSISRVTGDVAQLPDLTLITIHGFRRLWGVELQVCCCGPRLAHHCRRSVDRGPSWSDTSAETMRLRPCTGVRQDSGAP